MKIKITYLALMAAMTATAAVPLKWTVETSRVQPITFEAYHGETLSFEATLQSYGKPHSTGFNDYRIYWQTNGMDDVYWSAPATCQDNVVTARFTPEMDTGANVVRGFLGCAGEDFRAAFQLRLRPSPGATPNAIDLPASVIDFAQVTVRNAPWATVTLVEDLFNRNQHPVPYVISETATYHYTGDGRIPAGDYYKATTGDGHVRYAAQVPMPKGRIVMSGDDDDPVLQYFGSVFRISSIATRISSCSSMIDVGKYQVADLTFAPDIMLGLQCTFHVNLLNPVPELTGITMQPTSGYIAFTDDRGVQHSIYSMLESGPMSYTYYDESYDPNEGWWNESQRTITVSFERDGDTDFGFAVFGGSPIATLEQIDAARSKLIERTGRPGELGSGWGYKIYDFTNDERYWEIQAPRVNASFSMPTRYTPTSYSPTPWRVGQSNQAHFGIQNPPDSADTTIRYLYDYYSNDLYCMPQAMCIKEIVSTSNKYSTAGCQFADYRFGVFPVDLGRTDSTANGRFVITLDAHDIGISVPGRPYLWGSLDVHDVLQGVELSFTTNVTYTSSTETIPSTEITIIYKDFSVGAISTSGYTKTVPINFKAEFRQPAIYKSTSGAYKLTEDQISVTFNRTLSLKLTTASSLETTRSHADRIINDTNQHYYWDPAMRCTWEIAVTNGMFYSRKVSNDDYRREDHVR